MSPELSDAQLEQLIGATAVSQSAPQGNEQPITLATLSALKAYSARFYSAQPAEALRIARATYQLSRDLPPPYAALGSWTLANAYFFLERYVEADQLYTEVRKNYLAVGMVLDAARAGVGQVFVLAYLGQAARALALATALEAVLTPASQNDAADCARLANLLMNMGVAHELLGQYEDALAIYVRQMTLATQLDDQFLLAQAKHNRAYAFGQLNAFAEAEQDYLAAEELFTATAGSVDLVRLTMNYASLLATQGRLAEAKARYQQAQQRARQVAGLTQQEHLLTALIVLVELQQADVPEERTITQLQQAQAAFAEHGPALDEGLTWLVLGECYQRRAAWAAAAAAYHRARQLGEQGADRALIYRAWHGLAQVATAQNDFDQASAHYTAALQAIEGVRHDLRVDTFRAGFLTDKLIVYQDFARCYLQQGQAVRAFQIVERARARLISEQFAFRLAVEAARLPLAHDDALSALATTLTSTLQQLEVHYQQQRAEQLHANDSHAPPPTQATIILRLEETVQTLTRQIQQQQPHFAQLAGGKSIALAQICTYLQAEMLLYYHINQGMICLFCIDQTGIRQHSTLTTVSAVETAQRAFATAVERTLALATRFGPARALRYLPALLADANAQLAALYQLLIAPVADLLSAGQPLLIAPDGLLHYVPFHALYSGTQYLIEKQAVSYIPSATMLDLCCRSSSTQQGTLLCGYNPDHLDAVAWEIAALQSQLPPATIYQGAAATTTQLLAAAPQQRLLHIATHAHFRADRPMLSALALADRGLTLAEIARLQLDLDLAVLSGCETGHGGLQGADLLSLANGFLGAGARALVVSRWRVADSSTAEQMTHLYRALLAGAERNQALRMAQLALLQPENATDEFAQLHHHPAYWAPFILLGEWRALPGLNG